ncbi:hypothetical protein [Chryseobacterium indologenes]|uniref:Lipoprotein n=1 Tax=Chryseobacterium indologenes TaxID=253 RepID=A0A0N0ZWP4_CHRID|nr:hypothetical protein [Chryseobacterium indologenes]KPE49969.1 hypothetical protein AOB46_17440 [Chryseobacterium indologenes]
MKKSLLFIPIIILSCKKESKEVTVQDKDSTVVAEMPDSVVKSDSAVLKKDSVSNPASAAAEGGRKGIMREEKNGQIIRTAEASQLPFALGEEFTKDGQELVLKLKHYEKSDLKATITTNEKDFNIRFNQIRLPSGDYDGPFGRDITYKIPEKGEVWLIIGKSNMASGNTKGSFMINVE